MGDNNVTRSDPPLSKDEIAGLFDTVEEYLGDTEHWELADDSTPDPTDAAESLHKLRAALRALAQENGEFVKAVNGFVEAEKCFIRRDAERLERLNELAQENGRLKAEFAVAVKWHEQDATDYNELRDERDFFDNECKEHAATIAACVVERDEWKMKYESEVRLVDSIEAERDAHWELADDSTAKAEEIAILVEARDLAVANRNYWQAEAYTIRAKTIEKCVEIVEPYGFGPTSMMVTEIRALAQTDEAKPT